MTGAPSRKLPSPPVAEAGPVLRVLADAAAMDAAAAAWQALERRAADGLGYFQGFDWCRKWIAAFGGERLRPEIRTVWQDGRLVALWPLMREDGRIRRLVPLGAPHTQYAGLLVDPALDARALDAVRALLGDGLTAGGHDLALLESVPEGSPLAALLAAHPPLAGKTDAAAMLDLSAFGSADGYTAALSKTQRRNRNRRRNLLSRTGALSFEVLFPGDPGFAPALAECLRLKREWLRETGRLSIGLGQAGVDGFLASLTGSRQARAGACLSVLSAGGRLAAGELGFLHHGHYYAYLGAFDWALREASPGKVQMDMTVAWLIGEGVSTYDLLGNAADYKEAWSNRTLRLDTYAVPANLTGRAYAGLWTARLRPGLKRLYESMPHTLRRLAQFGQSLGLVVMIA
ncbi:GNAT family N-acetyltransferase [Shinella pollutisoli]|uniref:GNAT family N-acetyltransferase n=1 Tax=Shinella pollutisoli TaxID=2250594 RepID=A0ABV7DNI5_9HYPH|nr:GNAT family N-acetyltransferase [Shinella pollutisoli]